MSCAAHVMAIAGVTMQDQLQAAAANHFVSPKMQMPLFSLFFHLMWSKCRKLLAADLEVLLHPVSYFKLTSPFSLCGVKSFDSGRCV